MGLFQVSLTPDERPGIPGGPGGPGGPGTLATSSQKKYKVNYNDHFISYHFIHSFKTRTHAHAGWVCRLRLLVGRHLEVLGAQVVLEDPGAHHIQIPVSRVGLEVQGAPRWTLPLDP